MVPGPGDWSIRQSGAGLVPLFSDVQPLVVITAEFTVVATNLLAFP